MKNNLINYLRRVEKEILQIPMYTLCYIQHLCTCVYRKLNSYSKIPKAKPKPSTNCISLVLRTFGNELKPQQEKELCK